MGLHKKLNKVTLGIMTMLLALSGLIWAAFDYMRMYPTYKAKMAAYYEVKAAANHWRRETDRSFDSLDDLLGPKWWPSAERKNGKYFDPYTGLEIRLERAPGKASQGKVALVVLGATKEHCQRIISSYAQMSSEESYENRRGFPDSPKIKDTEISFGGALGFLEPVVFLGGRVMLNEQWLIGIPSSILPKSWSSPFIRGAENIWTGKTYWFDGFMFRENEKRGPVYAGRETMWTKDHQGFIDDIGYLSDVCKIPSSPRFDIVFVGV